MADRRRRPADLNKRAAAIVAEATGTAPPEPEKNPHAVALGKLGGKARAEQFADKAKRSEAARKAVNARWDRYRQAKAN